MPVSDITKSEFIALDFKLQFLGRTRY